MANEQPNRFLFETRLNWLSEELGILHAPDVNGTLHVCTPHQFGGKGKDWSPEHLLLGAVAACYMSTFKAFSKKMKLDIGHFECNVEGVVELVAGKYCFTAINVHPKVWIAEDTLREIAYLAMSKTQDYCLVSNTINAVFSYHNEVLITSKSSQPA